ncbi:hypothetical protein CRD17_10245 [Corynebacterium sp. LK30]|uniref:hypothetical protein n=1 Tax=unclassified Corynebacterium TaxID=2624378 RepID=UPI0008A3FB4F|nr:MULTISPECIES: hypothetical protein [unclassified Corynebacterium]MBC6807577.1 hypothetical protein [Corynebacterium sp. LK30]MDU4703690.1 hypothetical protein [Corynebacterium sp.]OFN08570.1 hypothetical protein HMPREF2614_06035 [Corynebacterium sp. HMSC074C11]
MKKTVIALVTVALALPLAACGADNASSSGERSGTAPYAVDVPLRGEESSPTVTYTYEDTRRDTGETIPPSTGVRPVPRQGVMDRSSDTREHSIGVSPWQEPEEWGTPLLEAAQ